MHGILMSHLDLYSKLLLGIVKLQKQTCRTIGLSLAPSFGPLSHQQNVASLSLFCRYYFGKCSYKLAQLVLLPFSQGMSTCHSDRLHDLSATIPRCYNDVYVNSFFPCKARFCNSLLIEFLSFHLWPKWL